MGYSLPTKVTHVFSVPISARVERGIKKKIATRQTREGTMAPVETPYKVFGVLQAKVQYTSVKNLLHIP